MSKKMNDRTLVLNRNYTLATTKGHVIAFTKGVPTVVPSIVYQECLAIGAQTADGEAPTVEEVIKTDGAPEDHGARGPMIMQAIKTLVAQNSRESFTAAGSPTVDAVAKIVGFKPQSKEIAIVWQEYHEEVAAAKLDEEAGN